jgi:hypothetical protein
MSTSETFGQDSICSGLGKSMDAPDRISRAATEGAEKVVYFVIPSETRNFSLV